MEGLSECSCDFASVCGKVCIPGGEGQPVCWISCSGDDVQVIWLWIGQEKVSTKALQEQCLLDIFLAKVCVGRLKGDLILSNE